MSDYGERKRSRSGCATTSRGGCAGCGCVLTLGLILTIIGAALGITITARVPGTHANVTVAGSVGKKQLTLKALSPYTQRTFGQNHNVINSSNSLTLGPAQGRQQLVLGNQPGAPALGLDVRWKNK